MKRTLKWLKNTYQNWNENEYLINKGFIYCFLVFVFINGGSVVVTIGIAVDANADCCDGCDCGCWTDAKFPCDDDLEMDVNGGKIDPLHVSLFFSLIASTFS